MVCLTIRLFIDRPLGFLCVCFFVFFCVCVFWCFLLFLQKKSNFCDILFTFKNFLFTCTSQVDPNLSKVGPTLNPIALRKAKTIYNFGFLSAIGLKA